MTKTALIFFSRSAATEARCKSFGLRNPSSRRRLVSQLTTRVLRETMQLTCDKYWVSDVPVGRCRLDAFGFKANLLQAGNDLRSRLVYAFRHLFALGYGQVMVIGNDTIIPAADLEKAAAWHGDVYGPSHDGGFYLLKLDRYSDNMELLEPDGWNRGPLPGMNRTTLLLKQRADYDRWEIMVRGCSDSRLVRWVLSLVTIRPSFFELPLVPRWPVDLRRSMQRPPPLLA